MTMKGLLDTEPASPVVGRNTAQPMDMADKQQRARVSPPFFHEITLYYYKLQKRLVCEINRR